MDIPNSEFQPAACVLPMLSGLSHWVPESRGGLGALQVEILAEALNLGDRSGVPREGVVTLVEQLFPGAIIPGAAPAPQPAPHCLRAQADEEDSASPTLSRASEIQQPNYTWARSCITLLQGLAAPYHFFSQFSNGTRACRHMLCLIVSYSACSIPMPSPCSDSSGIFQALYEHA